MFSASMVATSSIYARSAQSMQVARAAKSRVLSAMYCATERGLTSLPPAFVWLAGLNDRRRCIVGIHVSKANTAMLHHARGFCSAPAKILFLLSYQYLFGMTDIHTR
jgi:hypothetical protein